MISLIMFSDVNKSAPHITSYQTIVILTTMYPGPIVINSLVLALYLARFILDGTFDCEIISKSGFIS